MCGITGFVLQEKDEYLRINSQNIILKMLDQINHRGPDETGIWKNKNSLTVLGHKRLSILELTNAGSQPMQDSCKELILTFNGEIYNHLRIRKEISNSGHSVDWRGTSDTETLLESIKIFGLEKALSMVEGMFSFALWDEKKSKLFLVRDRIGEKPLYYNFNEGRIVFGSELKALKKFPLFEKNINKYALESLLKHNYIKGPYSIYNNTFKLKPGTILIFDKNSSELKFKTYWDLHSNIKNALTKPFLVGEDEIVEDLHNELKKIVRDQSVADVNVGCFLSGGIDSSLTSALMQTQSRRSINTFSIGFNESSYDESDYSKIVANILGTNHEVLNFTQNDAISLVPQLSRIYDEPFADSSQLPTLFVSQLASKKVKVCLSGDGGDELFCGYKRYFKSFNIAKRILNFPPFLKAQVSNLLKLKRIIKKLSIKDEKIIALLSAEKYLDVYEQFSTHYQDKNIIKINNLRRNKCPQSSYNHENFRKVIELEFKNDFLLQAMELDVLSYLVDDIMVKVDRASMNFSLETRAPFLNHNLLKKAFMIPENMRYKNNDQKYILRKILSNYLPLELFERPKKGFGIPLGYWLKNSLVKWADDLLDPILLKEQGFFDADIVRSRWEDHKNGRKSYEYYLWNLLMFQSWFINSSD